LNITTTPSLGFLLSKSGSWLLKKALALNDQASNEDLDLLLESVYNDTSGLETLQEKRLQDLLLYRKTKVDGKEKDRK
jgi:hypothetical protein